MQLYARFLIAGSYLNACQQGLAPVRLHTDILHPTGRIPTGLEPAGWKPVGTQRHRCEVALFKYYLLHQSSLSFRPFRRFISMLPNPCCTGRQEYIDAVQKAQGGAGMAMAPAPVQSVFAGLAAQVPGPGEHPRRALTSIVEP